MRHSAAGTSSTIYLSPVGGTRAQAPSFGEHRNSSDVQLFATASLLPPLVALLSFAARISASAAILSPSCQGLARRELSYARAH